MRNFAAIALLVLAACGDDVETGADAGADAFTIDPSESNVWGFWNMEINGVECDRPVQQIDINLSLEGDTVSVWWGLHSPENYEFSIQLTEYGALVDTWTTYGPGEEVHAELRDDGIAADASIVWRREITGGWCQVGPTEPAALERVRP